MEKYDLTDDLNKLSAFGVQTFEEAQTYFINRYPELQFWRMSVNEFTNYIFSNYIYLVTPKEWVKYEAGGNKDE